jgi:conjugal transfer mating pair stabilization protein TraG
MPDVPSTLAQIARPPPMNPNDRDAMIKTIAGEAGSEPPAGQAAVAHVILNRVAAGGYGEGIQGVVQAPAEGRAGQQGYHQFSMWNAPGKGGNRQGGINPNSPDYARIGAIVDQVYNGMIPDPTGGATHYYAPGGMPGGRPPAQWPAGWVQAQPKTKIGNQIFIGGGTGPGQASPPLVTNFQDVGIGSA